MSYLVIGGGGFTGGYLLKELNSLGLESTGTSRDGAGGMRALDLAQLEKIRPLIDELSPKVVFLTAGVTNMDYCELNPQETRIVNVNAVKAVAQATNAVGATIVFYSTDAVFDGAQGPYPEDAAVNPTSVYGKQKLEAENAIRSITQNHVIARTSSVFGWDPRRANFIARLVDTLSAGKEFLAPVDQSYTPTYVNDLAHVTIELGMQKETGVFNVAGPNFLSRYEFALKAADAFGLDAKLIKGLSTKGLKQNAPRLARGGLLTGKLDSVIKNAMRSTDAALAQMAKERRSF